MRIIDCNDYEEMSQKAAEIVKSQILMKPNCVLGLATGSTPIGMYKKLVGMKIDFSDVATFNLDEYYPIAQENSQSYYTFMRKNLYDKVNLKKENIFIPNGETKDALRECENYEKAIEKKGGIDLQILGIGQNGHIGFNEPGENLESLTHVVDLAESTINANARFFEKREQVPNQALTMGIATIMKARKIILMASGKNKAEAIEAVLAGKINTQIPATILCAHPDVTIICDKDALSK